ncbi:MAG: hypothetical protein LBQ84_02865 [Flavobacteriaceae bacterium]|jgi:hypothetical protein|nr:hypothetical protein [Flavobacteriaceae bacterium]
MSRDRKYLKIEEKIFNSLGKIGYVLIFVILFSLIMSIVNVILYCFLDNYYISKFIFTGEMSFSQWIHLMWKSYHFPYLKIILFALIFIAISIYRSNTLAKEFSK